MSFALPAKGIQLKNLTTWASFALIFSLRVFSQADVPTFKTAVRSTFIWGEDVPAGGISSAIKDPLTGAEIRELKHNDVEVSSRMGFEKLRPEDVAEFIAYSTTIVNNTEKELVVEQGGITVDGHLAAPLSLDSSSQHVKKRSNEGTGEVHIRNLYCFRSGNLPIENVFPLAQPSSAVIIGPKSSSILSGVIRDPRHYPLLCSSDGCFPKGIVRYSIRVGGHDYIFAWNGRSVANCGR